MQEKKRIELMTSSRWLILSVLMMTSRNASSGESECPDTDLDEFKLLEGEAFHVIPLEMSFPVAPDTNVTWYKKTSRLQAISSDDRDRIHHRGGALFFFDLRSDDSGLYLAQERDTSGYCYNHLVGIQVFDASRRGDKILSYGQVEDSDQNKAVPCPDPVADICHRFTGNFSWYKDFSPLKDHHEATLRINNASKADDGLYTCVCTWRYNDRSGNSSGSTELIHREPAVYYTTILCDSPWEMFADEGKEIQLKCSFLCGVNVRHPCPVTWFIDGKPFTETDEYHQTIDSVIDSSNKMVNTAVLTIKKVSAQHFHQEFKCFGEGDIQTRSAILTLKRRKSIVPSVIAGACVLLFCVFVAVLVKCFAIDLALLLRPYVPFPRRTKDRRLYDAYVVYQTQGMDPHTEDSLSRFIAKILPSVLENKCGYKLFIHGRDDIPGQDRVEMVEDCMKQSRRLIVILTPGSGQNPASPQTSAGGGFDWQVGLHHALVQREMSVILIQLGPTGPLGYSYLPLGLQYLIRQSAPIRWKEGSRGASDRSSSFWKRVRYLMPARPAGGSRRCAFQL